MISQKIDTEKKYVLMRKDDPITIVFISDEGAMTDYSNKFINRDLAPLQSRIEPDWLRRWWKMRSIPINQGNVKTILEQNGLLYPEQYLVKNLGLSLTDYYWIKPIDSEITWGKLNFYENDFYDNLLYISSADKHDGQYATPNCSLQGQLEKTWMILEDGSRAIVKGNHGSLSCESINEVIATEFHRLQGYDNYTSYSLIKISNKPYDYGCYSKAFTSLSRELVSAYAVVTSESKPNDISYYEHFINVCGKHGIDKEQLRADLEYQILTDFILTGTDRHLNNISVLRDADTLDFIRMSPIYDSGKCLFCNMGNVPSKREDFQKIELTSFASSEKTLLKYVRDKSLVDINKLPSPEYIRNMYSKDSQISERRINDIVRGYEIKIDMFRDYQLGNNIYQHKTSRSIENPATRPDDKAQITNVEDIKLTEEKKISTRRKL